MIRCTLMSDMIVGDWSSEPVGWAVVFVKVGLKCLIKMTF